MRNFSLSMIYTKECKTILSREAILQNFNLFPSVNKPGINPFVVCDESLSTIYAKEWTIFAGRDAILHVSAISPQRQKKAKKKFARMEQTLNKHEDIKREREYKSFLK